MQLTARTSRRSYGIALVKVERITTWSTYRLAKALLRRIREKRAG